MITKEQQQEYFQAMDEYYKGLEEEWNKAKQELNGLIDPKYFDFAESNDTYYSEGIIEIEKYTPERTNYPNHEHCKEGGMTYIKTTTEIESYEFESEYEGETVEYWVRQWSTGMEGDSFSGFLLLPLLDGKRFWKVGYSC